MFKQPKFQSRDNFCYLNLKQSISLGQIGREIPESGNVSLGPCLSWSDWRYYNFQLKGWKEIIKEVPLDTKQLCISLAMPKDLWGKSTLSWIALVVLCTCHLKNSRRADFVIDANSWKPPTIPLLGWGIQISCSLIDDFNSIQWEFVIHFPWSL